MIAITGTILILPDGPQPLTLRFDGDRIVGVGGAPQPRDNTIDLTGHIIYPGLINTLDRLEENVFPRLEPPTPFDHADDWLTAAAQRLQAPDMTPLTGIGLPDRLLAGAIRNLLAGTTSVVHVGQKHRRLTRRRFPLRLIEPFTHVQHITTEREIAASYDDTPPDTPWLVRVAEGTNAKAASEFNRLVAFGCLRANTVVAHVVGLMPGDTTLISETNAGRIWCPQSNRTILGETCYYPDLVGQTALGTESRLSGSRDLLTEIKLAGRLSGLSDRGLLRMMTIDAARLLRQRKLGRLAAGGPADFVLLHRDDPHLVQAHRAHLRLVVAKGKPIIGDRSMQPVFQAAGVRPTPVTLDGVPKLMARDLVRAIRRSSYVEPGLA